MKTNLFFKVFVPGSMLAAVIFTGCGGAGVGAEASDEAALSETQADSSDTVSAAAELGDDDLAAQTSPSIDWQKSIRPEVGAALRALIWDVKLCANAGSVTVDKQTAQSDCNLIGVNGQYRAGVTVTFNQCTLPSGGTIDGVITATTEKKLAAGQTCAAGALLDVTRTVSIDSLQHKRASGVVVDWKNVSGTASTQRPIATLPTELQLQLQGERSAATADGIALFHHLFQGAAKIEFTPGSATVAPSRTISGQLTIQHLLAKYTATITANSVEKSASCCRPTSGEVSIVRSGTREASHSFEFGPACGAVARDGQTLDLPECL